MKPSFATRKYAFDIQVSKQINQRNGPIIYRVKLMTLIMVHRLKKTSMTVSSSQKLS